MNSIIRIGSRGSKLALYQSGRVIELLKKTEAEGSKRREFEIVKITTQGDRLQRGGLGTPISTSVFTREIEEALLDKRIDLAVHSAKDLASALPKGLALGAVLAREDVRDALVSRERKKFCDLPKNARVGTSSLRRRAQLKRLRPDLEILELRGNVDTRIRKVSEGMYDGIVLAYAGLKRLGLESHAAEIFEVSELLPQAGQGAIAVQIRTSERELEHFLRPLNDEHTEQAVVCERSFLNTLEGGCQVPVGVLAEVKRQTGAPMISVRGAIFSLDGKEEIRGSKSGELKEAASLGKHLAEQLLERGGAELLARVRKDVHAG